MFICLFTCSSMFTCLLTIWKEFADYLASDESSTTTDEMISPEKEEGKEKGRKMKEYIKDYESICLFVYLLIYLYLFTCLLITWYEFVTI